MYQLLGVLLLPGNKDWRSVLREVKHALGSFQKKTTLYKSLQV